MDLLERDRPLELLDDWLQDATAGEGRLVIVGGEAGVGKTTLVDQFCARAHARARVLVGACDALSTPRPLGPLLDIAAKVGGELDRLVMENAPRDRIFRAALDELDVGSIPTIAVIEDAHWADEATLDLLRYLGRRIGQVSTLLIVTYRDDEVGSWHPLRTVLGDLSTAAPLRRIAVEPLSESAVRQLTEGSELNPTELYRQTGGNPFFVTEVIAAQRPGIPPTVRDAALARAARLSPDGRATLDAASVIGTTIEPTILALVAGNVDGTDECLATGMLRVEGDHLMFRHELARLAVLEAIVPHRRRSLHGAVLEALKAKPSGRDDLARRAHHAEGAADEQAVLTYAQAAARRAEELRAHREAAAQYARALRFADGLPVRERALLLEQRSYECYLTDQLRNAIEAREGALAAWRDDGDRVKQGESLRWLSRLYWYVGENAKAEVFGREALDVLSGLPSGPQLAWAYSNLAQLRMLAWDSEDAVVWGERAIALAELSGDTTVHAHALNNVGSAKLQLDDDRGWALLEQSLALALDAELEEHVARAYTNLSWNAVEQFQFDRADAYVAEGIAYCRDHDLDSWRFNMHGWEASALFHRGRWREATASIHEVLRHPNVSNTSRILPLAILGRIRARCGDPEVWGPLDEALELAERTGEVQRLGPVRLARAEAAWLAGDFSRTEREARANFDLAIQRGHRWLIGGMALWLWRLGKLADRLPHLPEPIARQIEGDSVGGAAAWDAIGCPYNAAMSLIEGDEPALRQALVTFERLEARPAAAITTRRLRELGVRQIPRGPRASTRGNPGQLTSRQVDILTLVAEGQTNAEIAEHLFLSPKTVEHHITGIFTKLSVESRAQAVDVATAIGLLPQSRGSAPQAN